MLYKNTRSLVYTLSQYVSFSPPSRYPFPSHGRAPVGASARPPPLHPQEPQFEQGIRGQRAQDVRQERRSGAQRLQFRDRWGALESLGYAGPRGSRDLLTSTFGTLAAVPEVTRGTNPSQ